MHHLVSPQALPTRRNIRDILHFPFAMTCRTIVFSHANSFPASTYRSVFKQWEAAGFNILAIEKLGHDPRYPVTNNWPFLIEQLREFVRQNAAEPVWLVGHSLGGYLSTLLASRYPDLARGVVLLDSPIVSGWKAASLGLVKKVGAVDRVMPSGVSKQRCNQWPDLESVRQHFTAKPKFAAFSASVLHDYVHEGTTPATTQGPRRLSFEREVETAIYRSMPHDMGKELRRRPPKCPVAFIGGKRSEEVRTVGMNATHRLVGARQTWLEGSHLFPFEHPYETAQAVLSWIHRFELAP